VRTKLDRDDGEGLSGWLLPTYAFSSSHSRLSGSEASCRLGQRIRW
jgi:hypothetical protein